MLCRLQCPRALHALGASPTQVRSLGRATRLGPMLLPTQITSAGKNLLASPVRLITTPASALEGLSGEGRVVENSGDRAVWQWQGRSGALDLAARMIGECDGFCWYEITLTPRRPLSLSSLRLACLSGRNLPVPPRNSVHLGRAGIARTDGVGRALEEPLHALCLDGERGARAGLVL